MIAFMIFVILLLYFSAIVLASTQHQYGSCVGLKEKKVWGMTEGKYWSRFQQMDGLCSGQFVKDLSALVTNVFFALLY